MRLCRTLLIAALVCGRIFAQSDTTPAKGPVFELPKLTVNKPADLPAPEQWHYTRSGHFEVIACGSERETRRLLADFQKFQQAVRLVWPVPIQPWPSRAARESATSEMPPK